MSLKEGVCSSCKSKDIFTNKNDQVRGQRGLIFFGSLKQAIVDTYLCMDCGRLEEYLNDKDFKNELVLEKVREKWQQVENH
ncbi:MAG: hypothetical protein KBG21_01755 [Ignavibacteria bacterium]|nr:hypothetical protein [Ignavibacteria bacterium]